MIQMANGEIWFATQEGLCSYDGLNWKVVSDSSSLFPYLNHVQMFEFADTSLYILGSNTKHFKLAKYHRGIWTAVNLPDFMMEPELSNSYAATSQDNESSQIIIGYNQTLYSYDGQVWSENKLNFLQNDTYITTLEAKGDSLWIGTNHGLLLNYHHQNHWIDKSQMFINIKWDDKSKKLYMLGTDFLGTYNIESGIEKIISENPIGLAGYSAPGNLEVKGNFIYYSYNSPLYQYNLRTKEIRPILAEFFDADHTCMKAIFDHEDNLWVSTLRGAFKVNNLHVYHLNDHHLLENEVSAVFEDSNGDIYMGGNAGLNILRSNGQIDKYPFDPQFVKPRIMDIVKFNDIIYLAGNTLGVVVFDKNHFIYDVNHDPTVRIADLHVYKNELYAATQSSILKKTHSGWTQEMMLDIGGNIRKIAFDDKNKLLLTSEGIYDLKSEKLIVNGDHGTNSVYCYTYYQGEILLGTFAGLRSLKNNQIVPVQKIDPQWTDPVYALQKDSINKGVWVGTGSGVFYHQPGVTHRLWKKNGLIGNEINRNAFCALKNGKMIIGTDEGVSFFEPDINALSVPTPTVEINGYSINSVFGQHMASQLSYDQNDLIFHFRTISFYDEAHIRYRVKLKGYDNEWQEIPYPTQRSVQYRNLKPGNYQFMVQASIKYGNWSDTAYSPVFEINRAFTQTIWFRGLIGLTVILIIIGLAKLRNQQLKAQNEKLETMVLQKTQELNERNQELVKTIKDLKSAQGQLIQSEKLASMGHLTAGIAHELNNPLNYIRGGAECIIKNIHELNSLLSEYSSNKVPDTIQNISYLMDESQVLAESILTGANKSTDIVKSLNSFTADAQQFYSFTDLEKEVETALTLLGNQIGFRITVNRMFGNVPPIECYPAKVNQIIVNLLINAIQAIENDGEITVRIFRKDTQNVCLEITDSGVGIPAENFEKVFEPFFTTKDTNSGLGLTMVESIVQEHHGRIKIRSKVNQGTKVSVWLPVTQDHHPIESLTV